MSVWSLIQKRWSKSNERSVRAFGPFLHSFLQFNTRKLRETSQWHGGMVEW